VFKYSAIFLISPLYIASVYNKPLVIVEELIYEYVSTLRCVMSELAAPSRMKQ
jgi:hypothetical protein